MSIRALAGAMILCALGATSAFAQSDCTKTVPPSPFGKDDQTGATNRVTAAVTKAAAAEIQTGKVTTMTHPLVDGVPLFGTRFSKTILTSNTLAPGAALGENNLTYMEDTWLSQSHVGTHIDGIGHIGRGDCYYNQTPMGKFINQNRMTKLGLENLKSFATPRRHHRSRQGLPECRQTSFQSGMQDPVPRQGNGDLSRGPAGRAQDVQYDFARRRRGVPQHRLG